MRLICDVRNVHLKILSRKINKILFLNDFFQYFANIFFLIKKDNFGNWSYHDKYIPKYAIHLRI